MTSKELRRDLERIETSLGETIQELVAMPADGGDWPLKLASASETLQKVCAKYGLLAGKRELVPHWKNIQDLVSRVQRLLDSAAIFYCGCAAVVTPQPASYAPTGEMQHTSAGGRIQIEA